MAHYIRKYWWSYLVGTVQYWGWRGHPWNWSWGQFKRTCWRLKGIEGREDADAEIKRNLWTPPEPPKTEAKRIRRECMNAGEFDTPYFSIRQ